MSCFSGEVRNREVAVDSNLPGGVFVGVAGKGGRGRAVGKERRDGGMLSGKGSGPTFVGRQAVVGNADARCGLVSGAHGAKNLQLGMVGSVA